MTVIQRVSGMSTSILISICIMLVAWNLKETVTIKERLAVLEERDAALDRRIDQLETWKNREQWQQHPRYQQPTP